MKFYDSMHIKYTILACLLFASLSAAAQQKKTEKTTIANPSKAGTEFPCTLEYDYTLVDSIKVVDGSYKINGQNTSKDLKESYSLNAQTSNGQLNGAIKADYTLEGILNGSKRYMVFSYTGSFQNGLPHGETKIKSFGQGSSAYDVSMSFNKGIPQGSFRFRAFVKKDIGIEGTFNSEGQMTGDWKFGRYDILAESAERNSITLLNGLKVSGSGYTSELQAEAQKFSEGKITEEELMKKGIIVNTSNNDDIEEFVVSAIRSRFIPFDSMPAIDLSKISLSYRYLDYFPAVNEEGFNLLLAEIDKYEGYTLPTYSSFGITTNEEGKPIQKTYGKESENYILNSAWNENMLCEILFTEEQAQQLSSQLSLTQERWKKGAIAICKSNYEILVGQQLIGKSASEISNLMKNAIIRGYKVEMDHSAKRYEEYSPIVRVEAGELSASTDSSAAHKYTSIVHIENKDSVGYRTYEWTIPVKSTDAVYICDDLNNSFTPSNFRRIRNDYDTINEQLTVINRNNKDFETTAKNILDDQFAKYTEYIGKSIKVDHNDLAGTIEQLDSVLNVQDKTIKFIELRNKIAENDNIIHKMSNGYKNIRKSYTQYIDNADVSWTVDVDLAKLEAIIAKQDSYIALLNRDDVKQINKSAGTDGIQL